MLLVTGGRDGSDRLDSTEILEDKNWRTITASLPSARYGFSAASIDNKILVFGKNIFIFYNINIIHYYSKYHMPIISYASLPLLLNNYHLRQTNERAVSDHIDQ